MTGFGNAAFSGALGNLTIEIKSLNSKFLDLSIRLPKVYADFETEWRTLISDKLERGKISVTVEWIRSGQQELHQSYNMDLFKAYYHELKKLATSVSSEVSDQLFSLALHSPDVIQSAQKENVSSEEKVLIKDLLIKAIEECDRFRISEGKVLGEKLSDYIAQINVGLAEVKLLDPLRVEKIRSRITGRLTEFFGSEGFDLNRLEQEMIYYIEKLDITEEIVRLSAHLDHFLQLLKQPQSNGKKLGFLAQEIGREINTIGSKANDATIQVYVVKMKDELERIKEQLNNIL